MLARGDASELGLDGLIDSHVGSADQLPYADKSTDVGICINTPSYPQDPIACFNEVERVLKEGVHIDFHGDTSRISLLVL
jgi:ubiquinone/menaquinone biosynthesis C-methylase UbiE